MCKARNVHCFLYKNSNLHEDKSVSPVGIYKILYSIGMIRLMGSRRVYMIRARVGTYIMTYIIILIKQIT